MVACSVHGCKGDANAGFKRKFHRIPKEPLLRKSWTEFCNQPEGYRFPDGSRICSKHFTSSLYDHRGRLKENAVPTIRCIEGPIAIVSMTNDVVKDAMKNLDVNKAKPTFLLPTMKEKLQEKLSKLVVAPCPATGPQPMELGTPPPSPMDVGVGSPLPQSPSVRNTQGNVFVFPEVASTPVKAEKSSREQGKGSCSTPKTSTYMRCHLRDAIKTPQIKTPKSAYLKVLLQHKSSQLQKSRRKLKNTRQVLARREKQIASLQEALDVCRQEEKISAEGLHHLESILPGHGAAVLKSLKRRADQASKGKSMKGCQYPPEVRTFILTLHFYSPKAYDFVRESLGRCLPHESVIRRWYAQVDGNPGFTKESFTILEQYTERKKAKGESVKVCLSIDGMHMRKHVDGGHGQVSGLVDYGSEFVDMGFGNNDPRRAKASQAIVIMAVGIQELIVLPLGYFLVASLNASEQSSLVKTCIKNLADINVDVEALTFDGHQTNLAMCGNLGTWLHPPDTPLSRPLKTSFPNPSKPGTVTNAIQDACHVEKLIRNALGDRQCLENFDGRKVEWRYFTALYEVQLHEGLHLANKLKTRHIKYFRNKMSVAVAAQTLSGSVAEALEICQNDLKLPQFEGCEGTVYFIRLFDAWFDMNSRSGYTLHSGGVNLKAPLCPRNKEKGFEILNRMDDYIMKLKGPDGTPVLKGNRSVAFTGVLICNSSVRELYDRLVENGPLDSLAMYHFSQDHLELFFGRIRMRGGWDNNPSARKFKSAYKKLLFHLELKNSSQSNCWQLCDIRILWVSSVFRRQSSIDETYSDHVPPITDHEYCTIKHTDKLSPIVEEAVPYIAGFVVKKVNENLECMECASGLTSLDRYALITKEECQKSLHILIHSISRRG